MYGITEGYLELYVDARKISDVNRHWGDKMPMMAMEEAGELIQAISKMERKKDDPKVRENLVNEIRDMYISLMALQDQYGINMVEINKKIDRKLNMKKNS